MTSEIDVVRSVYDAMAERDLERLFALIDPECVVTQDAALPWGGRHEGHEGFAQFGMALTGAIDSAVSTESLFMADGDVIQAGRTKGTARESGKQFDIAEVHRWTVRDGKVVRAHFSIDTAAMLEALSGTA
jgi:ketosteroid isomerase-like protein